MSFGDDGYIVFTEPKKPILSDHRVVDDYNSGMTSVQLVRKYDVSIATILRILHRNNVILRKKGTMYFHDAQFFTNINAEERAYWLGFLAADGEIRYLRSGSPQLRLHLSTEDKDHLKKYAKALKFNGPITDSSYEAKSGERYYSSIVEITLSQEEANSLETYGITPHKTQRSTAWNPTDISLYRHYWRGLFDGDGSLSHLSGYDNWRVTFLGTQQVLEILMLHLRDKISIRIDNHQIFENLGIYRVDLSAILDVRKIMHYLYDNATIYLDRKKATVDLLWGTE
jgi:DNA-binding transcriptional regulator WhiA